MAATTKEIQIFIDNMHELLTYPGAWTETLADTKSTAYQMLDGLFIREQNKKSGGLL